MRAYLGADCATRHARAMSASIRAAVRLPVPVKSRNASAAWNAAMPPPSSVAHPSAPCRAQQFGLQRPVDDFGHPQAGVQQPGGQRQSGVGGHPRRRGMHEAVGAGQSAASVMGARGVRPARAEVPVQRMPPAPPHGRECVHDGQAPAAQSEHGVRDGRPRASRAELHDPSSGASGSPRANEAANPGDVRVVANRTPALEDDGVDRAERLGLRGERVKVLDDELLARMGDVQPVEAQIARGAYEVSDRAPARRRRVSMSISR